MSALRDELAAAVHRERCCDSPDPEDAAFYLDHADIVLAALNTADPATVAAALPGVVAHVREQVAREVDRALSAHAAEQREANRAAAIRTAAYIAARVARGTDTAEETP